MSHTISVARDSRRLLDRLLDTPRLAAVVPRLQPEVLHRIVERCGLDVCGDLLALATPGQLAGVLDLDLWRADQPGRDEQFDADRFGVWLEVLLESGANVAARTVARMDVDLVATALAQHARVLDRGTLEPTEQSDDERPPKDVAEIGLSCDVGGYLVVATRASSWEAIVAVLMSLADEHEIYFDRVMRGCRALSSDAPEESSFHDLLVDRDQAAFDLAFSRERRRDQQGYVTPAQARAFLQASRALRLDRDPAPPDDPVARAYFRSIDSTTDATSGTRHTPLLPPSQDRDRTDRADDEATAAIVEVLLEADILPQPPRGLLDAPREEASAREDAPRLAQIQRQMQYVRDANPVAFTTRSQEIAYLANTLIAGCSIQARPITTQEASDAAVAICNLGLENWPLRWLDAGSAMLLPDDFLVRHDLVSVFQVGWTVLHQQVCMAAADSLIAILADLQCGDRETQAGLVALRFEMMKQSQAGTPWRARDALDVIAILDMPAWAALLGLIDELPVIHAGLAASQARDRGTHAFNASAFELIAENRQIALIRDFMRSLPDLLRG